MGLRLGLSPEPAPDPELAAGLETGPEPEPADKVELRVNHQIVTRTALQESLRPATATPSRSASDMAEVLTVLGNTARLSPVFSEEISPRTDEEEEEPVLKQFAATAPQLVQDPAISCGLSCGLITVGAQPLNDGSERLVLRAGRGMGIGPSKLLTIWHDRGETAQRTIGGDPGEGCYDALCEPLFPEEGQGSLYLLGELVPCSLSRHLRLSIT